MELKCEARELPFVTPGASFATIRQSPAPVALTMLARIPIPPEQIIDGDAACWLGGVYALLGDRRRAVECNMEFFRSLPSFYLPV
jgi:hypothetical protein